MVCSLAWYTRPSHTSLEEVEAGLEKSAFLLPHVEGVADLQMNGFSEPDLQMK